MQLLRRGKKEKEPKIGEEYWRRLKDIVDAVMESTEDERKKMDANLNQFMGKLFEKSKLVDMFGDDVTEAQINIFFSTVESIAPMLSDNKPITSVVPHIPYLSNIAWSYNAALKYVWETMDMQMNLYKAALSALIMKIAIFEVGFDGDKGAGGEVFCRVVDPRNFGLLPGYEEIEDCPMMWVRETLPLSWVRKNFPEVKKITPTASLENEEDKIKAFKYGDSMDFELEAFFATVYRVWMKDDQTLVDVIKKDEKGKDLLDNEGNPVKTKEPAYPYGKWCFFTEDEFLGVRRVEEKHGLPPFVEMKNYIIPFNFLGIDENMMLEGLNKELNRQLQYAIDHAVRHHRPDYEVDTGQMVDHKNMAKNIGRGEGHVFPKSPTRESPGRAIEEIPHRTLDPMIVDLIELIMNAQQEVSGLTNISKGQIGKKERQSASEIGVLAETSNTRTRQRVRNQDWTIEKLSYLFLRMMQQYYTEDRHIWWREQGSEEINYDYFGTSKNRIQEILQGSIDDFENVAAKWNATQPGERGKAFPPEVTEQLQDYEMFVQNFGDTEDLDPVYFDFSIEVQTNSTLPLDKQSQANLMIKLFEAKAVDVPLLLETLQPPGWQRAVERWNKAQQQQAEQKGGPQRPPIPIRGGASG